MVFMCIMCWFKPANPEQETRGSSPGPVLHVAVIDPGTWYPLLLQEPDLITHIGWQTRQTRQNPGGGGGGCKEVAKI